MNEVEMRGEENEYIAFNTRSMRAKTTADTQPEGGPKNLRPFRTLKPGQIAPANLPNPADLRTLSCLRLSERSHAPLRAGHAIGG